MKHVHWLGTGLSSIPGIRRLAERLKILLYGIEHLEKAQKSINHVNKPNVNAKNLILKILFQKLIQEILLFLSFLQINIMILQNYV